MSDVRQAFRSLRASPVVSAVAVVSLALGIGANTAIFSVVNSLLLRPLPVADPERLVTVSSGFAITHGFKAGAGMNYEMWTRLRDRIGMFDGGFAWAPARVDLSQGGELQPADALFASGGFFSTLGVPAMLGRTFTATDDVRGGGRDGLVAVIGYGLWQRRYAGAANVIGATLPVDGTACTIIGVMPPGFFGVEVGQPFDVVLPLATEPLIRGARGSLHHPASLMLTVMLRLKPEVSIEAATAALRAAQPDILGMSGDTAQRLPEFLKEPYVLVPASTGTSDRSALRRQYTRPLLTILAIVVLVLLVACVNIANLQLARATARRHELSVRRAIGASSWRLARQLLVESAVLSSLGACGGLLFARWASPTVIANLSTADTPVALDLPLDWRVLAMTAGITIATALLFGTAPALRAARVGPVEALKDHGRSGNHGRTHLSSVLIVAQVAVSLVLLVGAGLFLSTFKRLADVQLGFEHRNVLVVDVDTARAHSDALTRVGYYQQLAEAMTAVPGVASAAASTITPFSRATRSAIFAEPGRVHTHPVTPGFFATYGMRILEGRDFTTSDSANAAPVVIVSESYARKFFPNRSPLGATVTGQAGCDAQRGGDCSIVGVVGDAIFGPPRGGARPTVYRPLAQSATLVAPVRTTITLSVRATSGDPARLARSIVDALIRIHPQLAISHRPLARDVDDVLTQERLVAGLSGFFGVLGLLLSAVGLYGVTAYAVSRRRPEIGIRLALGATPQSVVRLVLSRIAVVVLAGVLIGGVVAFWLSRFVATLMYDVRPREPVTLAASAMVLILVSGFAGWVPAFRASRIDPATVLRQN
jgi:putative ABC transport system permease protein